jgi:hypothetical protein
VSEPCPFCGCPGEEFDGHACEDYLLPYSDNPVARAELLEVELQQAVATIEFMHDCLTAPPRQGKNGGSVYAYPEHTLDFLADLRAILPHHDYCIHSKVRADCESCMDGVHARRVIADWHAWEKVKCDGSSECGARWHVHGCFADKGRCDEVGEHLREVAHGRDD